MLSGAWPSPWRPNSSRLLTTPSDFAPMSTRISSLSMRTTLPSTTSPCLKLLMSESCSASSSSIVVGSGPSSRGAREPLPPARRRRPGHRRCRGVVRRAHRAGGIGGRSGGRSRAAAAPRPGRPRSRSPRSTSPRRPGSPVGDAAGRRRGRRPPPRSAVEASASAVVSAAPRLVGRHRRVGLSVVLASAVGSSALGTGSSATAIAVVAPRGAWSVTDGGRLGVGAVPPCCSSVNGLVTPGDGFALTNHERPERSSDRARGRVGVWVRGDRTPRSAPSRLLWPAIALQLSMPSWGRESLAQGFRAPQSTTIAAPCPNAPI